MRIYALLGFLLATVFFPPSPAIAGVPDGGVSGARSLLSFVESQGNSSYHCAPSGPCLYCQYSEKNDDKYRCSETGYHLPLKCTEVQENKENNKNRRKLLNNSSESSDTGMKQYITYRSCVPVEGEEKLSFLGFEVIMAGLLLISGPIVYLRQKKMAIMQGATRIPSNSLRF